MKSPSSSSVAPSRVDIPITPLPPRRCARNALTAVRDANDATFVGDEILHVDLALVFDEFRQSGRTMFVADLAQFLFDNGEDTRLFRQNIAQILDRVDELLVLLVDLIPFQAGQLIEAKLENLIGLVLAKRVTPIYQAGFVANKNADLLDLFSGKLVGEQLHARLIAIGRSANNANEVIEVGQRDEITFQRFGPFFRFA